MGNVYQIQYQYLGYGFIGFYLEDPARPNDRYILLHVIEYPNTAVITHILNPTLPLMAEVVNAGNNSNLELISASAMAGLQGETAPPFNPLNVYNSASSVTSFGDTNNNHILSIQNKATFGGVANRVPVEINDYVLGRSQAGAPLTTMRLYRNATFSAGLVFTDVDTNNSPVAVSTTTATITGGTAERQYLLTDNASSSLPIMPAAGSIVLQPGDVLTFAGQNSSVVATSEAITVDWAEQF